MLSRLKFRHKLALLPGVAAAGGLVLLVVVAVQGGRSARQLELIENGYYPSVAMSRDLQEALTTLQRALQDAVAAADETQLDEADTVAERIRASLAEGRANPLLDAGEVDELGARFDAYYGLARSTSRQMITGQGSGDLMANLREMTSRFSKLDQDLAARSARDGQRIEEAFARTRQMQRASVWTGVVAILGSLGVLVLLSLRFLRETTGALAEITGAAHRITSGDIEQSVTYRSSDELG
ncbi:MAG: HAMP domain-containing protein, partial [Gemmatimonadetes bacterium]